MASYLFDAVASLAPASSSGSASRKRSRTATIVDEVAHDLLKDDVLEHSIRTSEVMDQGRFALRKNVSLDDDRLARLMKQKDVIVGMKNVQGNIHVSFNKRDLTSSLLPAPQHPPGTPIGSAAPPTASAFSLDEVAKVVAPCDVQKIEEISQHILKCLPDVKSLDFKYDQGEDRKLTLVACVPKLDSSNIRTLRAHRGVAGICVCPHPHDGAILAVKVAVKQ